MSKHLQAPRVSMGRWNRLVVVVLGILLVSWGGPAASAFWSSVSSNGAAAKADSVAQGAKPTTSVSGANVTVGWAASTTAAGRSVTGYSIARYASATGGTRVAATGACSGTLTVLSCVEANVPDGGWYYAVTPLLASWQGSESVRSSGIAVDTQAPSAPSISVASYVNQANVSSFPVSGTAEADSTVTLTVTGAGAAPLTQRITTNSSGSWTANPLNLGAFSPGNIAFAATAADSAGNESQAQTTSSIKDVAPPTVTGVLLSNGPGNNKAGKIEPLDSLVLTFSEPLNATTVCSAWSNDGTTKTQNADNQVTVSISPANALTVASTGCPILRVGSVALGGSYNSSTTTALTYKGTALGGGASSLVWNPTNRTLTITLGTTVSGSPNQGNQGAAAATFTPTSGLTDTAGNQMSTTPVAGTASRF